MAPRFDASQWLAVKVRLLLKRVAHLEEELKFCHSCVVPVLQESPRVANEDVQGGGDENDMFPIAGCADEEALRLADITKERNHLVSADDDSLSCFTCSLINYAQSRSVYSKEDLLRYRSIPDGSATDKLPYRELANIEHWKDASDVDMHRVEAMRVEKDLWFVAHRAYRMKRYSFTIPDVPVENTCTWEQLAETIDILIGQFEIKAPDTADFRQKMRLHKDLWALDSHRVFKEEDARILLDNFARWSALAAGIPVPVELQRRLKGYGADFM